MDGTRSSLTAVAPLVALFALGLAILVAGINVAWAPLTLIAFAILILALDLRADRKIVSALLGHSEDEMPEACKAAGLNSQLVPKALRGMRRADASGIKVFDPLDNAEPKNHA